MNVVILGAGRVGFNVAKELSLGENDVSIIDASKSVLNTVSEKLDVKPVLGHASDISVLKEAGIDDADILVATTSSDEVNLTTCQIADFMFNVGIKIARIDKKVNFDEHQLFEKGRFSIDFVVSPMLEIIKMVKRIISIPGATDVVSCFNSRIKLICITCRKGSPIAGIQLKYIQSIEPNYAFAIIAIKHSEQWIIPNKNDVIYPGDEVYLSCATENVANAMGLFGYSPERHSNVIFIGGNEICAKVVNALDITNSTFKIIESDLIRAEELSERLNNIEILHGDPLSADVLDTAGIRGADVVISATDDDKINILSSLLSKKWGAQRVATILNDFAYADILYSLGINSILDSRMATASKILHYIQERNIENILSIDEKNIEVLSLNVTDNSYAVGVSIDEIITKNEIGILALQRNEQIFLLPKNMLLNVGDKILLVLRKHAMGRLLAFFQEKPAYLL